MNRVDKRQGFTLIELMLAMGFVSALLIAVAMTVIQIASIYNRGITLKDVNQAGRSIASELQRSISESASFNINSGVGSRYIVQGWGGRLCLGQYSYIWNYGVAIDPNSLDINRNVYSPTVPLSPEIRFVKVLDPNASYCTKALTGKEYKDVIFSDAVELLNVGEHNLAMQSFVISTSSTAGDTKTGQRLYSMKFLIGTNNRGILSDHSDSTLTGLADATTCKPPSEFGADPAYCSINQFDIVARAGNTVE